MLQSFHKAVLREAFSEHFPCPFSLDELEMLLQIFLPAYPFSLIMQKDKSSVAGVLPTLIITNTEWNRMKVTGNYKSLCNYLVAAMNYKFNYEKNSNYYCVALLFNISKLHIWAKRTDCKFIRDSVISNLVTTAELFLEKEVEKTEQKISDDQESIASSQADSVGGFFQDDNFQKKSY